MCSYAVTNMLDKVVLMKGHICTEHYPKVNINEYPNLHSGPSFSKNYSLVLVKLCFIS